MPQADLEEVAPARWDALLRDLGAGDVYLQRGYCAASARLAGGEPVLLHLHEAGSDAVFACLVRDDPVDVVTPYGYGGPVLLGDPPPAEALRAAYDRWCTARGVVTTFVVFHPLLDNARHAEALGFHRQALAGSVRWSLTAPDLLAAMHTHHRRLVRRAQREGYRATVARDPADLGPFVAMYEATMRRRDADPFYLFGPAYWETLAREVALVEIGVRDARGEPVARVLGMGEPPWLHYHLGAAADEARGTGASHLALYELARWGREHGYEALHLGGGVGGRDDSLLQYKRRFAPDGLVGVHLGKAVHDRGAYARLTGRDEIDWNAFFPAYRAPR